MPLIRSWRQRTKAGHPCLALESAPERLGLGPRDVGQSPSETPDSGAAFGWPRVGRGVWLREEGPLGTSEWPRNQRVPALTPLYSCWPSADACDRCLSRLGTAWVCCWAPWGNCWPCQRRFDHWSPQLEGGPGTPLCHRASALPAPASDIPYSPFHSIPVPSPSINWHQLATRVPIFALRRPESSAVESLLDAAHTTAPALLLCLNPPPFIPASPTSCPRPATHSLLCLCSRLILGFCLFYIHLHPCLPWPANARTCINANAIRWRILAPICSSTSKRCHSSLDSSTTRVRGPATSSQPQPNARPAHGRSGRTFPQIASSIVLQNQTPRPHLGHQSYLCRQRATRVDGRPKTPRNRSPHPLPSPFSTSPHHL